MQIVSVVVLVSICASLGLVIRDEDRGFALGFGFGFGFGFGSGMKTTQRYSATPIADFGQSGIALAPICDCERYGNKAARLE